VSYELWVINYELWVMNYELWIMSYELWIMSYEFRMRDLVDGDFGKKGGFSKGKKIIFG